MSSERPWWASFVWDLTVLAVGVLLILLGRDDTARHIGTALVSGFVIGGYALRYPRGGGGDDDPPPPPDKPNSLPDVEDAVKRPSEKMRVAEPSVALALIAMVVQFIKQLADRSHHV